MTDDELYEGILKVEKALAYLAKHADLNKQTGIARRLKTIHKKVETIRYVALWNTTHRPEK